MRGGGANLNRKNSENRVLPSPFSPLCNTCMRASVCEIIFVHHTWILPKTVLHSAHIGIGASWRPLASFGCIVFTCLMTRESYTNPTKSTETMTSLGREGGFPRKRTKKHKRLRASEQKSPSLARHRRTWPVLGYLPSPRCCLPSSCAGFTIFLFFCCPPAFW